MKTGILFDLDGTLLDTLGDLHDAVNIALEQHDYPARSLDEVRRFVGNGAALLIARAVPDGAESLPVLETFRAYYDTHCRIKTGPYPGILESLSVLGTKYPLAIVSNKPDSAVKALCADFFPGVYALGERPDCPRKPSPHMIFKAMSAIGAERCVYVGDSEVDVTTAKNAGVPCVSVLWGFRDKEDLQAVGAEFFCETPTALVESIKELVR